MTANETMLQEILQEIAQLPFLRSGDIPDIDLYMDQVTTFMEDRLQAMRRSSDDKILTKTMINNYAKNHLLPPPEKKKYSREHMLVLILIYYFKGVLSLQDIQSVLGPVTEQYFQSKDGIDLKTIYDEAFSSQDQWAKVICDDVKAYEAIALASFPEADEKDKDFLQIFSLICSLCLDMYVKKKVVEKLIDKRNSARNASAKSEPRAKKEARREHSSKA